MDYERINWSLPAVQQAYSDAQPECLRQNARACHEAPTGKYWTLNGERLSLNHAISTFMRQRLEAEGMHDVAALCTPKAITRRKKTLGTMAVRAADQARRERGQASAAESAEVHNPHIAEARDGPLQNPVLHQAKATETGESARPDPFRYSGPRDPPYSHVNPQDIWRQR